MNNQIPKILALFVILILVFSSSEFCYSKRAVPDDLIVHPVFIALGNKEGIGGKGSGFYLNNKGKAIYLISAFHVFFEKNK